MTTEEAIVIAIERNGRPQETDWDLAEAAQVLTVALAQTSDRIAKAKDLLQEVRDDEAFSQLPEGLVTRVEEYLTPG